MPRFEVKFTAQRQRSVEVRLSVATYSLAEEKTGQRKLFEDHIRELVCAQHFLIRRRCRCFNARTSECCVARARSECLSRHDPFVCRRTGLSGELVSEHVRVCLGLTNDEPRAGTERQILCHVQCHEYLASHLRRGGRCVPYLFLPKEVSAHESMP